MVFAYVRKGTRSQFPIEKKIFLGCIKVQRLCIILLIKISTQKFGSRPGGMYVCNMGNMHIGGRVKLSLSGKDKEKMSMLDIAKMDHVYLQNFTVLNYRKLHKLEQEVDEMSARAYYEFTINNDGGDYTFTSEVCVTEEGLLTVEALVFKSLDDKLKYIEKRNEKRVEVKKMLLLWIKNLKDGYKEH